MYVDQYPHKLNSKSQLTLPAKVREVIEDLPRARSLYLLKWWAGAEQDIPILVLLTPEALAAEEARLMADEEYGPEEFRQFRSWIMGVDCDTQWRFVLRPELREHINVERDVIFLGNGSQVELWNPKDWEKQFEQREEAFVGTARGMARKRYFQG